MLACVCVFSFQKGYLMYYYNPRAMTIRDRNRIIIVLLFPERTRSSLCRISVVIGLFILLTTGECRGRDGICCGRADKETWNTGQVIILKYSLDHPLDLPFVLGPVWCFFFPSRIGFFHHNTYTYIHLHTQTHIHIYILCTSTRFECYMRAARETAPVLFTCPSSS